MTDTAGTAGTPNTDPATPAGSTGAANLDAGDGGTAGQAAPAAGSQTPSVTAEQWAEAQATIQRLEREKQDARVRKEGELKQAAKRDQLLNLAKAIGVDGIDEKSETVESLTQKLTGRVATGDTTSNAAAEAAREAKIELAVFRAVGEKADRLTNLRSFERATKDLDPTAADFQQKLDAAIAAEVTRDPSLGVREGAQTSGAEHLGGSGGGSTTVTSDEFAKMTMLEKNRLFMTNPDEFRRLTA